MSSLNKLLEGLTQEIAGLDFLIEPTTRVNNLNEYIVGELDEELKKLYTLAVTHQMRRWEFSQELVTCWSPIKCCRHRIGRYRVKENGFRSDTLFRIFWLAVRDSYQLWTSERLEIRKRWKIVTFHKDPDKEEAAW